MESPNLCVKCGNKLTDKEKKTGLPLCQNCIDLLTDTISRKIRKSDEEKIGEEIDNFSQFILSSRKLFKLADVTAIQCCFNIFMVETKKLGHSSPITSQKILKDAIKFIERELKSIDDNANNDNMNNDKSYSPDNDLVSMIDTLIQKGMKSDTGTNNDTIEDIEKCIDKGMSIEKDEDKKDTKKEDKKGSEKNKEDKKGSEKNKEDKKGSEKNKEDKKGIKKDQRKIKKIKKE